MDKGRTAIIIIILIVLTIFFAAIKNVNTNNSLLDYNLMEILTTIVVTGGIFFLTKANDDKKNKNDKIQDIIELLKGKFNDVFNLPVKKDKQAEYLHTFKYIDNKIIVWEKLTGHLNCAEDIKEIKREREKLDEFINENIEQGEEYFQGETVKEKIPNILCNIETHLDNIIIQIYDLK